MPEMTFRIRWPDGRVEQCYSPSTVIREHLETGARYALPDFLARSRQAFGAANERVRARFGMGCSRAMGQLASIEASAATFAHIQNASVLVESLEP